MAIASLERLQLLEQLLSAHLGAVALRHARGVDHRAARAQLGRHAVEVLHRPEGVEAQQAVHQHDGVASLGVGVGRGTEAGAAQRQHGHAAAHQRAPVVERNHCLSPLMLWGNRTRTAVALQDRGSRPLAQPTALDQRARVCRARHRRRLGVSPNPFGGQTGRGFSAMRRMPGCSPRRHRPLAGSRPAWRRRRLGHRRSGRRWRAARRDGQTHP